RCARTAPLVRSAHHGPSMVSNDVVQESRHAWSLWVSKPGRSFVRPILDRKLSGDQRGSVVGYSFTKWEAVDCHRRTGNVPPSTAQRTIDRTISDSRYELR